MSWYNNQNQGFIDATQELQSGTSQTIINEIGEISDVFIPKVLDQQNGTTDTIIVNNTTNSRIFIKNSNTTAKIRIEGGKLYLYYEYDFTNAPTITTGWIDVDNYITAIKQSVLILDANVVALDTLILAPVSGLKPRMEVLEPIVAGNVATTINHGVRIQSLEKQFYELFTEDAGAELIAEVSTNLDVAMEAYRVSMREGSEEMAILIMASLYSNASRASVFARLAYQTRSALLSAYLQNILLLSLIHI